MAWDPVSRYKTLLNLTNAIVSKTTREDLFRSLAKELLHLFHYDRFSISIYESESASLSWFATAEGIIVKSMDEGTRPLDRGPVAHTVISSRKPLVIPDMSEYAHWSSIKLMLAAGLRTTMAFPLIVRGNILGSLHFSFRRTPENLPELTEFMTEISGQVALAVDNMLTHATLLAMNAHLEQQKRYLLKDVDAQYHPDNFFFCSRGMREIMRQIEIIACSDASVLITGETGTGKDYIARYIHQLSDRRDGLCVKINCPALAASLFESELFGHAKGAFTGASTSRVGRFEMAHGGTVFLDEIGELPMALQAKLLHVLQDRRFERVGDSRPVEANFRVIAATNCDLERAIRDKSFRSDLYYRLNTVSFHIPPLRERVEEIEPLVHKLVRIQAETMHRIEPVISERAMDVLKRHTWPGNVRELKNLINRLIIIHSGKTVCAGDVEPILSIRPGETPHASPAPVPGPAPGPQPPQSGTMTLSEAERAHIARVLAMTRGAVGGKAGAAATLKMPKSTLQYKIRKYGLDPRDFVR